MPYVSFQQRFQTFIQKLGLLHSDKPEAVGQIMTTSIVVLPETAHIAELIPLMSIHGHRQIPIINSEHCLVGMVYQSNLIAALYNATLATSSY